MHSPVRSGSTVLLQVNIDGLPLYKSSSSQLWPILGLVSNYMDFGLSLGIPFVIGTFHGHSKPLSLDEYLREFVDEANKLYREGFIFNEETYIFRISSFVCDMPARAYIKGVTGHAGYGGCDKCTQKGVHVNSVTFPEVDAPLRTDMSFRAMSDKHHHNNKDVSPLLDLPIDMVLDFPIDYMHLVCLGVMRKLISLWLSGPLATRIGRISIEEINNKLTGLRGNIPCDFQRKPRQISHYERWKATELRQLLLYTGCVVLLDSLPKQLYQNFMLLSVGVGILLNPELCNAYAEYSRDVLLSFVKHFGELYGADRISYNVHGLVHLVEEFKRFGVLDNISSFPFESFLGKMKRTLRKPNSPLEQLTQRLSEQQTVAISGDLSDNRQLRHKHNDGPVIGDVQFQYKELHVHTFIIKMTKADSYVLLSNGDIVSVENIISTSCGSVRIIYRRFHDNTSVFSYPLPSVQLGIVKLGKPGTLHDCDISDIKRKYMVLPYKKHHVGIPVLHTC